MDVYRDAAPAARHAVDIASDKQGADILLIDVHEISSFADYLVILSAGSVRQIQALANDLTEAVESKGLDLHHREGANESGWVLLDFGDLVVHVFSPEQRDFYRLEQVWSKGKTLLHIQ